MTDLDRLAAETRELYWTEIGQPERARETASPWSHNAWKRVVQHLRGTPDGEALAEDTGAHEPSPGLGTVIDRGHRCSPFRPDPAAGGEGDPGHPGRLLSLEENLRIFPLVHDVLTQVAWLRGQDVIARYVVVGTGWYDLLRGLGTGEGTRLWATIAGLRVLHDDTLGWREAAVVGSGRYV